MSSGDGLYPTLVGIYEGTSAICRLTAQAYHYAALYAATEAARGVLQALKDGVDASMLEAKASNPSTTNPDAVRAEAAAAKAKADDDSIKANVLKQKAEAAKSTAQILLAKAQAAEAKAEEALESVGK